jgi:hypothetical protein
MGDREKDKFVSFTGKDGIRTSFEITKPVAPFLRKMGLTYDGPTFGESVSLDAKRAAPEYDDTSDPEADGMGWLSTALFAKC